MESYSSDLDSDYEEKAPSRPPIEHPTDSFEECEEQEDMAEDISTMTLEEYISMTREDAGLGKVRPAIAGVVEFELKGHFLKELRETLTVVMMMRMLMRMWRNYWI